MINWLIQTIIKKMSLQIFVYLSTWKFTLYISSDRKWQKLSQKNELSFYKRLLNPHKYIFTPISFSFSIKVISGTVYGFIYSFTYILVYTITQFNRHFFARILFIRTKIKVRFYFKNILKFIFTFISLEEIDI